MSLAYGYGLGLPHIGGAGGVAILLSNRTITADASQGDVIGTLSVPNSEAEWTFSLTDTAGGRVQLDAGDDSELQVGETELEPGFYPFTVQAEAAGEDTLTRTFSLTVAPLIDGAVLMLGDTPLMLGGAQLFLGD